MRAKKKQNPRIVFLISLMVALFVVFGSRSLDFQIVSADEFASKNANLTAISTRIEATRGIIADRYGRPIAVNREGYNIVFNSAYMKKANYNETIRKLTEVLTQYETKWNDNLPITKTAPYTFTEDSSAVATLKSKLGLNDYATVENCIDEMVRRYALERYSDSIRRTIMGVRYSMERGNFSVANPYTFSEDISSELMLTVAESFLNLSGVEIDVVTYREYTDPKLAPHIVGTIGKIASQAEWDKLKDQGYSYNDYVGKNGVEYAFENYLNGKDGEMTYYFDKSGNVVYTEVTKEPMQGDTVMLTIDSKLQKVAQDALASNINTLNSNGGGITGGAVCVTKVDTGEILAAANYPSYSLNDYYNNYATVAQGANNPLFDRSLRGLYPPGSSFKPLVAIAGLEGKIIDRYSTCYCTMKYTYYKDYQPSCMHYHKSVNVIRAIAESCNYFFFDVGRQVGITKLNEYAYKFGFGSRTGVEIIDAEGIVAGPTYSAKIGTRWFDGLTLQASIGQSDNSFSPIQLANYTATLANGGTRYKTTLLSSVKSSISNKSVYSSTPVVADTVDVSKETIDIVKLGMKAVAEEGTASAYFKDYPISVGGKTGTAQTTGLDHNVIVIFAPYENPEIAISIVVEHGEKSYSTGPVAKAILDEYFFGSIEQDSVTNPNQILR